MHERKCLMSCSTLVYPHWQLEAPAEFVVFCVLVSTTVGVNVCVSFAWPYQTTSPSDLFKRQVPVLLEVTYSGTSYNGFSIDTIFFLRGGGKVSCAMELRMSTSLVRHLP